jgi:hypothetical protein
MIVGHWFAVAVCELDNVDDRWQMDQRLLQSQQQVFDLGGFRFWFRKYCRKQYLNLHPRKCGRAAQVKCFTPRRMGEASTSWSGDMQALSPGMGPRGQQ